MTGPRLDPTEHAHLRDRSGSSPPIHRYAPAPDLTDLVRRHWIPVWSLPAGESTVQRVLQYPVCLVVVAHHYARLVGVTTGLGRQELAGTGWAVGTMLQPAAGSMLLGGPVTAVTDDAADLVDVPALSGLAAPIRTAMAPDPGAEDAHRRAIGLVEEALRALGPVDEEGLLLNQIVAHVESSPEVLRVDQLPGRFGIGERSLQRLVRRRVGISAKWLIQRRRLQEAAAALRAGGDRTLAETAAELGYSDQAHFTRDFRSVTGLTPGQFAAEVWE